MKEQNNKMAKGKSQKLLGEWIITIFSAFAGIFLLTNSGGYGNLKVIVIILGVFALFPLLYRFYKLVKQ